MDRHSGAGGEASGQANRQYPVAHLTLLNFKWLHGNRRVRHTSEYTPPISNGCGEWPPTIQRCAQLMGHSCMWVRE